MSSIEEAQEKIKAASALLNEYGYEPPERSNIAAHLLAANVLLDLVKADQPKLDMVGAVILREGRELKLFAEGFRSGYLRISVGDDGVFNIRNVLVDEVGGDIAEIKVDEWKPAPMKLQGVACVNPDCDYEFVAGMAGRVLQCPDCASQQIPFAKGADDA